jgi:carboxymethylenebutenolidase
MPDLTIESTHGGSTKLSGYIARPSPPGPWPGVVVMQEIWGMDDVLRRQCDRLAELGYLAIAPNLFSDGGAKRCLVATFRAMNRGQGKAFADIEAARQFLLSDPECTGKVGIIGFCMGGAFALVASTRGFDVASDNYGALPRNLDNMLDGACPIVASYGGKDRLLPSNSAKTLEQTLTRLSIEHDVTVYPTAGHQFLNDAVNGPGLLRPLLKVTNAGPEPEAAAAAWTRIEKFFAQHLS